MNRKQKRDWLRTGRGLGNNTPEGTPPRRLRITVFGGVFGKGLMSYFDKKAFAA